MPVIRLKTDHFSSRELHSIGSQKTMNPVLVTQGPLPAPGKYFSSPTETPGENQGHCHVPGCPSLLSRLSPAICGTHAHEGIQSQSPAPTLSRGAGSPWPVQRWGRARTVGSRGAPHPALWSAVSPGPPSCQAWTGRPHTGRESGGHAPIRPPAGQSLHSRPGRGR